MAFKIKDLMISEFPSDLGAEELNDFGARCTPLSCLLWIPACPARSVPTLVIASRLLTICPRAASLEALAALKEQLKEQLAGVENLEVEIEKQGDNESPLPTNVEEVEALAAKIEGALNELRVHRDKLSKNSQTSGEK